MQLIDSHCHLHDKQFFDAETAEKYLKMAITAGINKIVCIGTDGDDSLAAKEFAKKVNLRVEAGENLPKVYWTYGFHPFDAEKAVIQAGKSKFEEELTNFKKIVKNELETKEKPVAIGEIGLDYHYQPFDRAVQIACFEQQLQLAVDLDLPVVFHIREAFDDFWTILQNFRLKSAVVHSFSDSAEILEKILTKTDFYVGVNGLATFAKLPLPPLPRMILETDAPFLTPKPYRGKQNHPAMIANISEFIAEKENLSTLEVAKATTENAERLYSL